MVNPNPIHQFDFSEPTRSFDGSISINIFDKKRKEPLATLHIVSDSKAILNARNNAIAEEFLASAELAAFLTNTIFSGITISYTPYESTETKRKKSKMEKRCIRKKMAQQT